MKRMLILLLCFLLPVMAAAQSLTDLWESGGATKPSVDVTLHDDAASHDVSSSQKQVIDQADALSDAQILEIAAAIDRIEAAYQVDIVVLVTRAVPKDYSEELHRVRNFADDFYDNGGYGMGPDYSGMLYLIDLNNRVQYISTGGVMIEYISDAREEAIFDATEYYLRNNQWGRAALTAVNRTAEFLAQGRERGFFLYDEETGRRLSGLYNPLESYEVLIALVGGAATALIFVGAVTATYGLKGSTYRYDMAGKSTCDLVRDDEQFIRQTVSRMARSSGSGGYGGGGRSGGGGGVHRSSGGRSHGGGGRRF